MTENDLIGLYCIGDDFFQRFVETKAGKRHIGEYYGKRGPRRQLSVPEVMYESGRKPCAAARKNMRRLMTKEQCQLLRNRNIIENVWSVLKLNYNLIYHRARSVVGMFRHFFSVFLLFCFIGFMKNITFPYKIQSFAENSIFDLINIVNHNLHCDVSPMPEKYFSIPLPVSHFISSHTFPPGD